MSAPLGNPETAPGAVASSAVVLGPLAPGLVSVRAKLADYAELSKLRLSLLVLLVTATGFALGSPPKLEVAGMIHCLLGTALVAFGASAWNQLLERRHDARMIRTADRPIPAGRISEAEAAAFGTICGVGGLLYLVTFSGGLAGLLAGVTLILYVAVYTPLKRLTPLNTPVGAVPGAIPPLIGYAAAAGRIDAAAWTLFAVLFAWQMPHFYAIAWMYRDDYARGGFKMLSVIDPTGGAVSRQTILFTLLLLAASALPALVETAGGVHVYGALLLGAAFLSVAVRFAVERTRPAARLLLWGSILYLPLLMLVRLVDRFA